MVPWRNAKCLCEKAQIASPCLQAANRDNRTLVMLRFSLRASPTLLYVAFAVFGAIALVAVVGNVFTTYSPTQAILTSRLKPPSFLEGGDPRFLLGTDRLGRDMIARLIFGLRISLAVAVAGTIIGAVLGIAIGFIAARFRGVVEEGLMMIVDLQVSLPFILLALTMLAFFGNSITLFIILMGLHGWENYARLTRGVVLSAANQPYGKAITGLGASSWRLYGRHILPNVASALIVQLTFNFPQIIVL